MRFGVPLLLLTTLAGSASATQLPSSRGQSELTVLEQAGDWQPAALGFQEGAAGLQVVGDTLTLPEGANEGQWTSQALSVRPFTELVPSWNARTGQEGGVSLEVRVGVGVGEWSRWYSFGRWSAGEDRRSATDQKDAFGEILTDLLRLKRPAQSFQYRVTLQGPGTELRLLAFDTSLGARAPEAPSAVSPQAAGRVLEVPQRSQLLLGPGGDAWCSPTSLSMILGFYGVNQDPRDIARGVHDWTYDGTGNWPFNTAYAAEQGFRAVVTRLPDLRAAEPYLQRGIPLAVSLGWKRGELPGAALAASSGHLMVLVGFDAQGNPVLNDPAAPDDRGVRRSYPRAAFEKLWLSHSGGLAYVITPPAITPPERPQAGPELP